MTRREPAQYDWAGGGFDEQYLTKHFTRQSSRKITCVVVHHMTIKGDGKGKALDACYRTWQSREASAHYGVDGSRVRKFVRDRDRAWATGSASGNQASISIEHANSSLAPLWRVRSRTWKTGARLAAFLHIKHKLGRPVDGKTLRKHSSFTATACPGPYLGKLVWKRYVREAQKQYDLMKAAR